MAEIDEGQVLLHYLQPEEEWQEYEGAIEAAEISYAWGDIQPKWSGGANVDMYWVAEHHRLTHVIEDENGLLYPKLVPPNEPKEKGRGITQGPVRTTGSYADPDNQNNFKGRGRKVADNIDAMSFIGLDVDDGFPMWRMAEILSDSGYMFWMCPTYSHGKTAMIVPGKEIFKHDSDPQKAALAYLAKKGLDDTFIEQIGQARIEGPDVIIPHPVLQKYRVFLFAGFEENFYKIHNDGVEGWRYTERQQMWADGYKRIWQDLGVPAVFDAKCGTVDRFFYTPKFPNNKPHGNPIEQPSHFGAVWHPGEFLNLSKVVPKAAGLANKFKSFSIGKAGGNQNGPRYIPRDESLLEVAKLADFPMMDFVEENGNPEHIRATKGDKIEVKCPWEADHSVEHGETSSACWVAGDGGEHAWIIACQAGGCSDPDDTSRGQADRLKFLDHMCREGELLEGWTGRKMIDWYNKRQGLELPEWDTEADTEADIFAGLDTENKLRANNPKVRDLITKLAEIEDELDLEVALVDLREYVNITAAAAKKAVVAERKRLAKNAEKAKAEAPTFGQDGRLTVYDHMDKTAMAKGIVEFLVGSDDEPEIFLLATGDYGRSYVNSRGITVSALDIQRMDGLLNEKVNYLKVTKEADVPVVPPAGIRNAVFGSSWMYTLSPPLKSVVHIPFFDAEGNLLTEPGYNAGLEMLHDPNIELYPVSSNPTDEDVTEALAVLDDLLDDFPFSDDFSGADKHLEIYHEDGTTNRERGRASRANFVGCLLTPMARNMITGSVPIAHIDKSQPNTGGTKLLSLVTILYDGERPPMMELKQGDEFGKMILPIIESGRPLICFDNIDTGAKADNKTLAGAVTSGKFEGRILGKSQVVAVPLTSMIWTVGNNFYSTDELTRRMVPIRLDAEDPQPQNRTIWKHPQLEAYALENRSDLIWAAHTLISRWVALGKPMWSGNPAEMSSFESWAGVIGGIMESVWPEPDAFLSNLDSFRGQNQDDQRYGAMLVQVLYDHQQIFRKGNDMEFADLKMAAFDDGGQARVPGLDLDPRGSNFSRDWRRKIRGLMGQTVAIEAEGGKKKAKLLEINDKYRVKVIGEN